MFGCKHKMEEREDRKTQQSGSTYDLYIFRWTACTKCSYSTKKELTIKELAYDKS